MQQVSNPSPVGMRVTTTPRDIRRKAEHLLRRAAATMVRSRLPSGVYVVDLAGTGGGLMSMQMRDNVPAPPIQTVLHFAYLAHRGQYEFDRWLREAGHGSIEHDEPERVRSIEAQFARERGYLPAFVQVLGGPSAKRLVRLASRMH